MSETENDEQRPNPEDLLKIIKEQERRSRKGLLKIFLGMAAGVGKTYAMLDEARRLYFNDGVNLVIGIIDTHGRKETAQLLNGLPVVPEKEIVYKETLFKELDLDGILRLNPELVLVDELAHSNVPGSRHPKRWQDVEEILEKGIDVYTTLNVQHIESLKDLVENITGVSIRETVPDSILETATYIELVDLTPTALLQRLREGKVYLGEQAEIAARNFFQEDRLTALREIILRFAAEKVDHDLHGMIETAGHTSDWKPRERLLVCVSSNPRSQKLIRNARRFAFRLGAPWIALFVNTGAALDDKEMETLHQNLSLARELGAEVITTNDPDLINGIKTVARQKEITLIILSRPRQNSFVKFFIRNHFLNYLIKECPEINLYLVGKAPIEPYRRRLAASLQRKSKFSSYLTAFCVVLLFTFFNWLLLPFLGYKVIGFIFLLGILFLGLFLRKGPVCFAALQYAFIWYYFFIPDDTPSLNEDRAFLILYLFTAIITSILIDRSRLREELLYKREEATDALYQIARDMAAASTQEEVLNSIKKRLNKILQGTSDIILKSVEDGLMIEDVPFLSKDEKEKSAAIWVFENEKEAGWSTTTLPLAQNLYIPLKGFHEVVGVLTFKPFKNKSLSLEEKNFIYTVAQQLANYIERSFAQEKKRQLEQQDQVERIYHTILNLVSKEFQTPSDKIQETISELKKDLFIPKEVKVEKILKIENSAATLIRMLGNIAAMTKLSEGLTPLNKELHEVKELIQACLEDTSKFVGQHKLKIQLSEHLVPIYFDFALIEILLNNLIFNAIEYSAPDSTIEIEAKCTEDQLVISVADEGKGIPNDLMDTIFERFYRVPGTSSPGIGLGLAIAKTIAEIHHGYLIAANREEKGAIFTLYIPIEND